ncbi:MAG: hypothetical protein EKK30_16865 [Hyphomicrobium sp.]|nr:MAG: hypothetical protein EKK30_16865 [Hyphomicrobium sp.]
MNGELKMTRATALIIQLALVTAQRIGEVAGIAKSELSIDGDSPVWIVPGARTKNGHSNRVPLTPLAVKLIKNAIQLSNGNEHWLFPSFTDPKKRGSTLTRPQKPWSGLATRSGLIISASTI